jgi:hypothetical protein
LPSSKHRTSTVAVSYRRGQHEVADKCRYLRKRNTIRNFLTTPRILRHALLHFVQRNFFEKYY